MYTADRKKDKKIIAEFPLPELKSRNFVYSVFVFYHFSLYSFSFLELTRDYQGKRFSSHNVFRRVKMLNIHIIVLGTKFKVERTLPLNLKPQISQHQHASVCKDWGVLLVCMLLYCFIHLLTISFFVLVFLMIYISFTVILARICDFFQLVPL